MSRDTGASHSSLQVDLDVLLLAVIEVGFNTAYSLNRQLGLSVGASRPALRRLERLGFVRHVRPQGGRKKREYYLTHRGRLEGEKRWRELIKGGERIAGGFEQFARLALVALIRSQGGDVVPLLSDAVQRRAKALNELLDRARGLSKGSRRGSAPVWAAAMVDSIRIDAEIHGLRRLRELLGRRNGKSSPRVLRPQG